MTLNDDIDSYLINTGDDELGPWSEEECQEFIRSATGDTGIFWLWNDAWDEWRAVAEVWPRLKKHTMGSSVRAGTSPSPQPKNATTANSVSDDVYDEVTVIATVVWLRLDEDRIGPRSPAEARRIVAGHPRAYEFEVSCAPNGEGAWRPAFEVWPRDFPPPAPAPLPPPLPAREPTPALEPPPLPHPPPLPQPSGASRKRRNAGKQRKSAPPQPAGKNATRRPAGPHLRNSLIVGACISFAIALPIFLGVLLNDSEKLRVKGEAELADLTRRLEQVQRERASLEQENATLKQSPRFYFDLAVEKDRASNDDAGDQLAIEAYALVQAKFPGDPLSDAASTRTIELRGQIQARAQAISDSQQRVRALLVRCRSKAAKARKITDASLRFNAANDVDLNRALAGSRRAQPYQTAAREAQEQALALLDSGTPDPGNSLRSALDDCTYGN